MAIKLLASDYYTQIIASSTDSSFARLIKSVEMFAERSRDTYCMSNRYLPEALQILYGSSDPAKYTGTAQRLLSEELNRRRIITHLKEFGADGI